MRIEACRGGAALGSRGTFEGVPRIPRSKFDSDHLPPESAEFVEPIAHAGRIEAGNLLNMVLPHRHANATRVCADEPTPVEAPADV